MPYTATSLIQNGPYSSQNLRPRNMNLHRAAPLHSKHFGPTVMTSAFAELLGAWSRDGTKWHLGLTGLAHSFPKVHAAERKLDLRSGPTSLISSRPSTFDFVFLAGWRSRLSTCG